MFTTVWTCDNCGHKIIASQCPSEEECVCYYVPEDLPVSEMTKEEKKLRYKIQYAKNGYSWNGQRPNMYLGSILEHNYPERGLNESL